MTSVAVERRPARIVPTLGRLATFVLVLAVLWGAWEGYKWLWETMGWTWPFVVDDITMPPLQNIFGALFDPAQVNGPLLIDLLWHAALFTAKEAAVGFAIGCRSRRISSIVMPITTAMEPFAPLSRSLRTRAH